MKFKFILDYTESPIWAMDEEAKQKFGYNVDINDLKLDAHTITRVKILTDLFRQRLNPVYQGFPSFWSGKMHLFFQCLVKEVYSEVEKILQPEYELVNEENDLMNQSIDAEQIDRKLKEFLNDPSKFADDNGITYDSKIDLNEVIQKAFLAWKQTESDWLKVR